MKEQILNKVRAELKQNDIFLNNYMENHLIIWPYGRFETICLNEFGQGYGPVREGKISLSIGEMEFVSSYDWTGHFSSEFYPEITEVPYEKRHGKRK